MNRASSTSREILHTLAMRKPPEESSDETPNTARNVHRWSFLTDRQPRSYDQRLIKSRDASREKSRDLPTKVRLFTTNVQGPRYPFITNPPKMHLISDIPDPAAYFANDRTRWAAANENIPYRCRNSGSTWIIFDQVKRNVRQR